MKIKKSSDNQATYMMFNTKKNIRQIINDVMYNLEWDEGDTFTEVMGQFLYDLENIACEKVATDVLGIDIEKYYDTHTNQMDLSDLQALFNAHNDTIQQ